MANIMKKYPWIFTKNAEKIFAVPAQDSPMNILNILDDYSIEAILVRLTNVNDFYTAAQVCIRFQDNAKSCFPRQFKSVIFNDDCVRDTKDSLKSLPLKSMKGFLKLFGQSIESIHWIGVKPLFGIIQFIDKNTLDMIAYYCGKTLIELKIKWNHINFYTSSKFMKLEKLEMTGTCFKNFNSFSHPHRHLKQLKLFDCPIDNFGWMTERFMYLERIILVIANKKFAPSEQSMSKFIRLNQQLRELRLVNPHTFVPRTILHDICMHMRELECLILESSNDFWSSDIVHLNKLTHLKSVGISMVQTFKLAETLLLQTSMPIEAMNIKNFDDAFVQLISKKKTLKKVHIYGRNCTRNLVNFVQNIQLDQLHINFAYYMMQVQMDTIIQILENVKNISNIQFITYRMKIDASVCKEILALAKNRVKVHIINYCQKIFPLNLFDVRKCEEKVKISKKFSALNSVWLKIEFKSVVVY